jgi:hypothetical protein
MTGISFVLPVRELIIPQVIIKKDIRNNKELNVKDISNTTLKKNIIIKITICNTSP